MHDWLSMIVFVGDVVSLLTLERLLLPAHCCHVELHSEYLQQCWQLKV